MTTVNYRGVSKSGTGYLRMTDDGWKMRMVKEKNWGGVEEKKREKQGWKNEMKTIKKCNRNREEISKYKRVKNSKTKGKKCYSNWESKETQW